MRHRSLAVDFGIAAALAVLVLIVSAGVAVAGMVAIVIVVLCGVSLGLERRAERSHRASPGRSQRASRARDPERRR